MKNHVCLIIVASGLLILGCGKDASNQYSRGLGQYPGNPDEHFAPVLVVDNTYRNVAELKAAYHSSSYDYNLTAQLVTDGLISTEEPASIQVSTQKGDLPKNAREYFFDGKPDSRYSVEGDDIFIRLDFNNMKIPVDRFVVRGSVQVDDTKAKGFEMIAYASNDGNTWEEIAIEKGISYPGIERPPRRGFGGFGGGRGNTSPPKTYPSPVVFKYDYEPKPSEPSNVFSFGGGGGSGRQMITRPLNYEVKLSEAKSFSHYKIAFKAAAAVNWTFSDWDFYEREICTHCFRHYSSTARGKARPRAKNGCTLIWGLLQVSTR